MDDISKEEFWKVYGNHPPSGWIKFAYKYFSKGTEREDMKLNLTLLYILLSLFLIGFTGTIFGFSRAIIGTATVSFGIILTVLVLYLFSAIMLNNARIGKIAKELGISKYDYNRLVEKYGVS
jgi:hypothetical protein